MCLLQVSSLCVPGSCMPVSYMPPVSCTSCIPVSYMHPLSCASCMPTSSFWTPVSILLVCQLVYQFASMSPPWSPSSSLLVCRYPVASFMYATILCASLLYASLPVPKCASLQPLVFHPPVSSMQYLVPACPVLSPARVLSSCNGIEACQCECQYIYSCSCSYSRKYTRARW